MDKVRAEDVQTLIDLNIKSYFDTDNTDANSMSETIDSFIANSQTRLRGDAWDAVRDKMSQYKDAIICRLKASNILGDAINKALIELQAALGNYPDLDPSKLEKLEQDLANNRRELASLGVPPSIDKKDEQKDNENIPSFDYNRYNWLNSEIARLENLIIATENFKKVSEKVLSELDEAYQEVKTMFRDTEAIQPSTVASFSAVRI